MGGILDVFGFNFDVSVNNFPLKGAWLPFIHHLISNTGGINENIFLGNSKTIKVKDQKNMLEIVGFDGYYEQTNTTSEADLKNLHYPGFYAIISNKDTLATFSANVDSSEILSDKIDSKSLKQSFGENCFIFNNTKELEDNLTFAEKGYEIWHILLSIAMSLLILESTMINTFEQKV